jgi:hypothetical protein
LGIPNPEKALPAEASLLIALEREVEDEFRPLMRQALQRKIDAHVDAQRGQHPTCPKCAQAMGYHDQTPVSWLTRFGRVTAMVAIFLCKPCKTRRRPLIEILGAEPGRISGSLARLLALLGVIVPYDLAAQIAHTFFGVQVNAMTVWRAVQRLGEAAERYTNALSEYHSDMNSEHTPADDPVDAILLGVDGCSLGMQVREKRRHRKSPDQVLEPLPPLEDGHFREVKTGVLLVPSERMTPSPGRRSVLRRVLVTCLGCADTVFNRVWAKLQHLGWLGDKTVVVIIGDGAEWIWNRASMFLRRCEILDFWHAIEHAWEFARLQYGQGSKLADQWIHRIAKELRAGKVEKVIARLQGLKGTTEKAQEKLEDLIRYYTTHAQRMRYDEYLRLGYGIGSGAVESAHKQVVHARLRQAGMRWSESGAQRLLALRLLLLNGDWALLDRLRMVSPNTP